MALTLGSALGALGGGNPVAGGLALGGSLLGGFLHPQMPAEQKRLLRISAGAAGKLYNYANGVPGSDPQELAALAQEKAQLGEDQYNQQQQAYGALSPTQGGVANPNLADFVSNLMSHQQAQRMSLESNHLMNALAQRKAALQSAAGVAQGSQALTNYDRTNQFPSMFGALSQSLAYQAALKAGHSPAAVGAVQNTLGGGGTFGAEAYGKAGAAPPTTPLQAITPFYTQANQGMQGSAAPGNETPGGYNDIQNKVRQSNGLGTLGLNYG